MILRRTLFAVSFALAAVAGCASPTSGKMKDGSAGMGDAGAGGKDSGIRDGALADLPGPKGDFSSLRDASSALDQQPTPPDMTSLPDQTVPPDLTALPDLTTLPDPDMTPACPILQGACNSGLCVAVCFTCSKLGVCVNNACQCL